MNPSAPCPTPSLTFLLNSKPNPNSFNPQNQCPLPPDLSTTLSSLNDLLHLSHHTTCLLPPSQTPNPNFIQCPFDPSHLMPPESLFLHHLRCPSSPRPLPYPDDLLKSLCYPKTLKHSDEYRDENCVVQKLRDSDSELSFSLDDYFDFRFNFFYRDCPGVVSLSHADAMERTFKLPCFLSIECVDFIEGKNREIKTAGRECLKILPSEFWAIRTEVEAWNDFPTTYTYGILLVILGLGVAKECDLMKWVIANSPRYGVVIDTAMQQHIFLLFSLCLKSIIREALNLMENKQNLESNCAGMSFKCPNLIQASSWLASQLSILYRATNGKTFVLNLLKACILKSAWDLLLFPLEQKGTEASAFKGETHNLDTNSKVIEDAKPDIPHEESTNCARNNIADGSSCNRKIFVSQVAAAVAALHERALLEDRIKGLWFSQQPSKYQLVAEHSYVSEKASEERKKRSDYRPVIDHDGLPRQQSSSQESIKSKTQEDLLAEERDYKRRRMSYRGKKIKRSTLQVMRDIIEEYMEEIKQAQDIAVPVEESEASGMFPSKQPSGHEISIEAQNLRKSNHDSPAATVCNPSHSEQQTHSKYSNKSKAVKDASARDYEQPKRERYRNHDYVEDQWNTIEEKYDRKRASRSPERHRSHSRSHKHSGHHKKQDYSNEKKHDHNSRSEDRWQRNSRRNHGSESLLENTFEDRYVPSEYPDIWDDGIFSGTHYIKPE